MPSNANEEGDSPGCTLAVIKIYYLFYLNLIFLKNFY